jgi:ABC-type sugar transport system permease subunit
MTKGGPAHASELMATWIFSTMIEQRDAGYAATLAVALGTICSAVIALYVHLRRRGWEV